MKKCLVVCLLSIISVIVQGAEKRSSGSRKFLSKSDLGQSVRQQDTTRLSSSASIPRSESMLIPQQRKKYNDASPSSFNDLVYVGSPNLLTYTVASEVFTRQKNSSDYSIPK